MALALVMIYPGDATDEFRAGRNGDVLDLFRLDADPDRLAPTGRRSPSTVALVLRRRRGRSSASSCGRSRTRRCWPRSSCSSGCFIFNALAGWLFGYHDAELRQRRSRPAAGSATSSCRRTSRARSLVTLVVLALVYRLLPLHAAGPRDARRGAEPGLGAAGRHPRRLDAGARLGPRRRDRRGRRHDGGADRLSRSQHDGRHPALRLRRRACSAASTIPGARCSAASSSACSRTSLGAYVVGDGDQAFGRAGHHRRRAGRQALRPVRPAASWRGSDAAPPRLAWSAARLRLASRRLRAPLLA